MRIPSDNIPGRHVMTRRAALAVLAGGGVTLLAGGYTPKSAPAEEAPMGGACIVRPQQIEGPYFVDERLQRSDIRSDPADGTVQPGMPLQLAVTVSRIRSSACTPLAGAQVDVWQCNAVGVYSDVTDPGFRTKGHKFLRGYQVTDPTGAARFMTIYPGWYPGRTVHIHFKIRTTPTAPRGYAFTSQLYFDDARTDHVHTQAPYASKGPRTVRNADDGIFAHGGEQLILPLTEQGDGYTAMFTLGLQLG
jgi:protocatechuate 3,4-dioxygenase beta subunit